ncbi:hypothetical protein HDV06_005939 [Boothiomyces sp. JEL0866]|nr:hypothetical protein HDV06_005939 [Boothiomyces sp. JEL0866]
MSNTSYLFQICDFHINYANCGPYTQYFEQVDHVAIFLYTVTTLFYAIILPIQLVGVGITKGVPLSKCWGNMESAMMMNITFQLIRIGFHVNLSSISSAIVSAWTDADILNYLHTNIALEFVYYIIGGTSVSTFVFSIIDVADASHLYDKIKIGEKVVDCGKLLKLLRLIGLIIFVTFASLWATKGLTTDYQTYNYYRRCFYGGFGVLSTFVSFPIVLFFGNKIIKTMLESESVSRGSKDNDHTNKSDYKSEKTNTNSIIQTNAVSADQKSATRQSMKDRRASISKNFRELAKLKKISDATSFKWLLRAIAFWLYFMLGISIAVIIVVHETVQDRMSLLVTKCITELYIWTSSAFAALYLFRRAMNARMKK